MKILKGLESEQKVLNSYLWQEMLHINFLNQDALLDMQNEVLMFSEKLNKIVYNA